MPAKRRSAKARTGQLTSPQRIDLFVNGARMGGRDDRRNGQLWDDDEHREAAYLANRDSLLARYLSGERPFPPAAAAAYDPDPEVRQAAIDRRRGRPEVVGP